MRAIWPILLVALLAGCQAPVDAVSYEGEPPTTDDCPIHWHAVLHVVVLGEQVVIGADPRHQDAGRAPEGVTMSGPDGVLHFEHAERTCVPFDDVLRKLGIYIAANGGIVLREGHPDDRAGSYPPNATHVAELYAQPEGGDWVRVPLAEPSSFLDAQVPDGVRMLLVYRAADQDVAPLLEQVPELPDAGA